MRVNTKNSNPNSLIGKISSFLDMIKEFNQHFASKSHQQQGLCGAHDTHIIFQQPILFLRRGSLQTTLSSRKFHVELHQKKKKKDQQIMLELEQYSCPRQEETCHTRNIIWVLRKPSKLTLHDWLLQLWHTKWK